jgi:hypothetical protein
MKLANDIKRKIILILLVNQLFFEVLKEENSNLKKSV